MQLVQKQKRNGSNLDDSRPGKINNKKKKSDKIKHEISSE